MAARSRRPTKVPRGRTDPFPNLGSPIGVQDLDAVVADQQLFLEVDPFGAIFEADVALDAEDAVRLDCAVISLFGEVEVDLGKRPKVREPAPIVFENQRIRGDRSSPSRAVVKI